MFLGELEDEKQAKGNEDNRDVLVGGQWSEVGAYIATEEFDGEAANAVEHQVEPRGAAHVVPLPLVEEDQDGEDDKVPCRGEQLGWQQRYTGRCAGAIWEEYAQDSVRLFTVTTASQVTANAAEGLANGNAWNNQVRKLAEGNVLDFADEEAGQNTEDTPPYTTKPSVLIMDFGSAINSLMCPSM